MFTDTKTPEWYGWHIATVEWTEANKPGELRLDKINIKDVSL